MTREPDRPLEAGGQGVPELTVVIPTKDRPTLLPRAITSVLDQGEDVEVIVVDDGSLPANADSIREICDRDGRVRLVRNEVAHGAPHGRNQGLDLARGRFWATLDDDDQWLPGKWAAQRALLREIEAPDDVVVITGVRGAKTGEPGTVTMPAVRTPERPRSLSALFRRVRISAFLNTYVVPTDLMRAIGGYDERLVWGEHTDVLIRLSKVARFAGVDSVSVLVDRQHELAGSRVGRNWRLKVEGIRLLLAKHEADFTRDPGMRAQYVHVLGVTQLRAGDRWRAARTFAKLAAEGPTAGRRIRGLGHLIVTVVGGPRLWRWMTRVRGTRVDETA